MGRVCSMTSAEDTSVDLLTLYNKLHPLFANYLDNNRLIDTMAMNLIIWYREIHPSLPL